MFYSKVFSKGISNNVSRRLNCEHLYLEADGDLLNKVGSITLYDNA